MFSISDARVISAVFCIRFTQAWEHWEQWELNRDRGLARRARWNSGGTPGNRYQGSPSCRGSKRFHRQLNQTARPQHPERVAFGGAEGSGAALHNDAGWSNVSAATLVRLHGTDGPPSMLVSRARSRRPSLTRFYRMWNSDGWPSWRRRCSRASRSTRVGQGDHVGEQPLGCSPPRKGPAIGRCCPDGTSRDGIAGQRVIQARQSASSCSIVRAVECDRFGRVVPESREHIRVVGRLLKYFRRRH
jgi:hypothetical protein